MSSSSSSENAAGVGFTLSLLGEGFGTGFTVGFFTDVHFWPFIFEPTG